MLEIERKVEKRLPYKTIDLPDLVIYDSQFPWEAEEDIELLFKIDGGKLTVHNKRSDRPYGKEDAIPLVGEYVFFAPLFRDAFGQIRIPYSLNIPLETEDLVTVKGERDKDYLTIYMPKKTVR